MRSKSSDSNRRRPRAFSLLELLVVLGLLGLVAAVVAPGAARLLAGGAERTRRAELLQFLVARRLDALTGATRIEVELVWRPDATLTLTGAGASRAFDDWPDPLAGAPDPPAETAARVAFGPEGRAGRRHIAFRDAQAPPGSDTMWAVVFDPVSGLPRLVDPFDPDAPPGAASDPPGAD